MHLLVSIALKGKTPCAYANESVGQPKKLI